MSGRLVLVESDAVDLRAALLIDRRLEAIEIDRTARPTRVGAVVRARAGRAVRGLGTILKLPDGTEALLDRGRGGTAPPDGDEVTVQIVRDARGEKLPVASRSVALTGRALVHLPLDTGIHTSRRLDADPARRDALLAQLKGQPGGWILRRTAGSIGDGDLSAEIGALMAQADDIAGQGTPDAFSRLLSDYGLPAPDAIVVSGRLAEASATSWCTAFAPSLLPRVERHTGQPALFDMHDIESAIAALESPRVALPAGGSLVIERTEALTAIDVNAGDEPNLLAVNLGAAAEIARQLRLRHIGGLIVVDFVSISRPADRKRTLDAFLAALANDPAQTYVLPISNLGLVEMSRERRGPELAI